MKNTKIKTTSKFLLMLNDLNDTKIIKHKMMSFPNRQSHLTLDFLTLLLSVSGPP